MQDLNFFVFGPLVVVFAIGLHLGIRPTRFGAVGPALLVVSGTGLVLAGVFPVRDAAGAFAVTPATWPAFLGFLGTGTGFVAMSQRMDKDPSWRGLSGYVLASGIAVVVLFLWSRGASRFPTPHLSTSGSG